MMRFVITGVPGAGKTAIIRHLELGFSVVEEAATDVVAAGLAQGIEPWRAPSFVDSVARLQKACQLRAASQPDAIVVSLEALHDVRIIHLNRRSHLGVNVRSWDGDSIGRWERGALLVDTTNFTDRLDRTFATNFAYSRFDQNLHVIERLTRASPDVLLYEFSIEDPTTFTEGWSAVLPMRYTDAPIYEVGCHEGNYALPNILRGARAQERNEGR